MKFIILFAIPFLSHCGLTLKTAQHHEKKQDQINKQIALLHIDQTTLSKSHFANLKLTQNSQDIVLVVHFSLEQTTSSLALVPKSSSNKKNVQIETTINKDPNQSKRDAFTKKVNTEKQKYDPIDGSKKIITAKDLDQHSDLTNHDVYANRKTKVFDFAKVPKGVEVFRGMKITRETANKLLEEGIDSPVLFNFKTGVISPHTPVFNTIKKHHLGTGLEGKTQQSLFVSTSYDKDVAIQFAETGGVVFKIKTPEARGIDVNKALGDKVFYPEEKEIAIIGSVQPQDILGYYPVIPGATPKLGEFQCQSPCAITP